jgi:hypothetical protein
MEKKEDEQFLKETATKAAHNLRISLGDIEPLKLLQLYKYLYVLVGGDEELMIHWLNTHNTHLNFNPAAHLTDARMDDTIRYLEGMVEH